MRAIKQSIQHSNSKLIIHCTLPIVFPDLVFPHDWNDKGGAEDPGNNDGVYNLIPLLVQTSVDYNHEKLPPILHYCYCFLPIPITEMETRSVPHPIWLRPELRLHVISDAAALKDEILIFRQYPSDCQGARVVEKGEDAEDDEGGEYEE